MPLADVLRGLDPVERAPSLVDLGGEEAVRAALARLENDLLSRLVEAVAADWTTVDDKAGLGQALVERLSEIEPPLEFAGSSDALLRMVVAAPEEGLAPRLMDVLLRVSRDFSGGADKALRAGHAVRAAVDLGLLRAGISTHSLLGVLERVENFPSEMASPLARAAGRLLEHSEDEFLLRILEEALQHDDAAAEATMEMALKELRDAFVAGDSQSAITALERGIELFERARDYDENRPDARAYIAASRAVLGFAVEGAAVSQALVELHDAQREFAHHEVAVGMQFRGAQPLRSLAAWQILGAQLASLRNHLDKPDHLHLRPGMQAFADAYAGLRLGVLEDEQLGLRAFVQPVIARGIAEQSGLLEAMEAFAKEAESPPAATNLAKEVMRPKVSAQRRFHRLRRARRRR